MQVGWARPWDVCFSIGVYVGMDRDIIRPIRSVKESSAGAGILADAGLEIAGAILPNRRNTLMSVPVDSFVREIAACSPSVGAARQATIDYWAPDNPPAIIALSELGRRIVDDFNSVSPATNEAIFKLIEEALAVGDAELATAVATGIIEGIVGRAVRIDIWNEVHPRFGKLSASHAKVWASPC
jgi:hypothetical protein